MPESSPPPSPHIFRAILQVEDIEAAVVFYRRLLDIDGERISAGRHYFDCGGTILACFDPRADGDDFAPAPNTGTIFFAVDDLEYYFNRARAAGCAWLEDHPGIRAWGERSFYLRDPTGNPLCFVDARTLYTGPHATLGREEQL